jgi:hypothetical protein
VDKRWCAEAVVRVCRSSVWGSILTDFETLPRHTGASAAIELLCDQRNVREALKLARQELQKARRARSRKRFAFWTEVATEMENLRADRKPEDQAQPTSGRAETNTPRWNHRLTGVRQD